MTNNQQSTYIALIVIAVIAALALIFIMQPKEDNSVSRAASEFSEGVEEGVADAKREITGEDDRTTGEKIGDSIEEFGEDVGEATDGDGKAPDSE